MAMKRRSFLSTMAGSLLAQQRRRPNFVVILADDLGYGDLSSFGHPTIRTPNIDRMAVEGMKFTSFYTAASVCTPARIGLLTGRYPVRSGLTRTLYPREEYGIADTEITLADALRDAGYATACIGKWGLGDLERCRPNRHGFSYFYGLHHSNDMDPRYPDGRMWPDPLQLYRNNQVVESPVDQSMMTAHYTEEAVKFIRDHKTKPFFLYLAHSMPHRPWFSSPRFHGNSARGAYGDAVEEIDWGVGEIVRSLRENGLLANTLLLFTSDNGASVERPGTGSNGLLRGGKSTTWEGGMRVPCVATWPGVIPAATTCHEIASTLDLLPTFIHLARGKVPADRAIDGLDILPALQAKGPSPRQDFFYFKTRLEAIRSAPWKLHLAARQLFQLDQDPEEKIDLAAKEPSVVARLAARAADFQRSLKLPAPLPKPDKKWNRHKELCPPDDDYCLERAKES